MFQWRAATQSHPPSPAGRMPKRVIARCPPAWSLYRMSTVMGWRAPMADASSVGKVLVDPADLLRWVLEAGGHEHRPEADEQALLGDAGGSVGRAHRREGGARQHERAARGGERGDRDPVGHAVT